MPSSALNTGTQLSEHVDDHAEAAGNKQIDVTPSRLTGSETSQDKRRWTQDDDELVIVEQPHKRHSADRVTLANLGHLAHRSSNEPHAVDGNHVYGHGQAQFGDNYSVNHNYHASEELSKCAEQEAPNGLMAVAARTIWDWWQMRKRTAELIGHLGEWALEAQKGFGGAFGIPVLSAAAVLRYLSSVDQVEITDCQSSFKWAKFLCDLGIRPGQGVVLWRRATRLEDPLKNISIELDIEGPALCHIANWYLLPVSDVFNPAPSLRVSLSFGTLTREHKEAQSFAYEPSWWFRDTVLRPRLRSMPEYLLAMQHGISEAHLALPLPNERLRKRVEALLKVLETPLSKAMLTYEFIEAASRIKRRVTTIGGDSTLLEDMVRQRLGLSSWMRPTQADIIDGWFLPRNKQFQVMVKGRSTPHRRYASNNAADESIHMCNSLPSILHQIQQNNLPELNYLAEISDLLSKVLLLSWEGDDSVFCHATLLPLDDNTILWSKNYRIAA